MSNDDMNGTQEEDGGLEATLFNAKEGYDTEVVPLINKLIETCERLGIPYGMMFSYMHEHGVENGEPTCNYGSGVFADTQGGKSPVNLQMASFVFDADERQIEMVMQLFGATSAFMDQVMSMPEGMKGDGEEVQIDEEQAAAPYN